MSRPVRIAIWGAPRSGKTTLASELHSKLLPATEYSLADTTPWLHTLLAGSTNSQTPQALLHQRDVDLTLLTGLDLHPDGMPFTPAEQSQRMRMDQTLRAALSQHALPFALVYGTGAARSANALQAIQFHLREPAALKTLPSRWRWPCEKCSDSECEHRLFSALLQQG